MGLLDQYDKAKRYAAGLLQQVPQNAQDMYQGLLSAPQQVADLFSQKKGQQLAQALQKPPQANPQQWMDAGLTLAGMAPVGGLIGMTKNADVLLDSKAKGINVYRAGNEKGMTASTGGPTFYATQKEGAMPYAYGDASKVRQETINPNNVFDTQKIEHRKLYEQFLKDGNHPYGYGKTARPFWTSEYELKKWLDNNGHNFDSIMFDENTGVPSYAVYGSK